jgi:hypothetical protein
MFAKTIDASKEFITLLRPSFFVMFAKRAVEGTPHKHLIIKNDKIDVSVSAAAGRLNGLLAFILMREAMSCFRT